MNFNLSTKEKFLLEDQKNHEQLCIQKYTNYANQASCPQLKKILQNNAKQEQEHLNTINQLLSGQIPSMNNQQQSNQQSMQSGQIKSSMSQFQQSSGNSSQDGSLMSNRSDKDMCSDLLMTEKYVSNSYDTAIFEFANPQVRSVLNHIQKEEQQHGESIFKYMQENGMYTVK